MHKEIAICKPSAVKEVQNAKRKICRPNGRKKSQKCQQAKYKIYRPKCFL